VFVQGVRYHKLECVGRGGSSKVFKVRHIKNGSAAAPKQLTVSPCTQVIGPCTS
jgi:hypothetical protein